MLSWSKMDLFIKFPRGNKAPSRDFRLTIYERHDKERKQEWKEEFAAGVGEHSGPEVDCDEVEVISFSSLPLPLVVTATAVGR